jgi:hypothetical protein
MKTRYAFAMLFVLAAASGIAFAQTTTTSAPILQISSYSTSPTDVYAGTLGYLQLTILNSGNAGAQSVSLHYSVAGIAQIASAADISAGSSTQLSIPFKIPPEAAGSIQPINVDIYYNYPSTSGSNTKQTSLSIPIKVLQQQPLEAKTTSFDKTSIAPGEKIRIMLNLTNTGGVINNLVITMPANSSFTLDGASQLAVGTIPISTSVDVPLVLDSSSSTPVGSYNIPVVFTYEDALQQPSSITLYVGPVNVLQASAQYRLSLVPTGAVELGSQADFALTLENTGSDPISAIVDINSTSVFTPIGMQRVYFDSVLPGDSKSVDVTLGVAPAQSPGYYTLPLTLTTDNGNTAVFETGISVDASPEITVSLDTQSGSTQVQIANTGNSQIRSVYASAKMVGSQSSTESFIGTLNVDDFATLQLTGGTGLLGSSPQVEVDIRFKDSDNIEHTINKTLAASGVAVSNLTSSGRGFGANGSPGAGGRGGGGPLGALFGGGAARSGSGLSLVEIAGIVIVVAVGGFLFYKYYWKKRKAASDKPSIAGEKKQGLIENIGAKIGIAGKSDVGAKQKRKTE